MLRFTQRLLKFVNGKQSNKGRLLKSVIFKQHTEGR